MQNTSTIILWDLHGVLFTKSFKSAFFAYKKILKKPTCFFQLLQAIFTTQALLQLIRLTLKGHGVSQAYLDVFKPYNHLHTQLMLIISRLYTPEPNTLKILKILHAQPSTQQYIFSNIGPDALILMQTLHPAYFIHFSPLTNCINSQNTPTDLWVWKPNKQAYRMALSYPSLLNQNNTHIIFIDDKKKNIRAAQSLKISSILFKNSTQTARALAHMQKI